MEKLSEHRIVEEGMVEGFGTWTLDDKGILTIDGSGEMPDLDFVRRDNNENTSTAQWIQAEKAIQTAELAEGITKIGEGYFITAIL